MTRLSRTSRLVILVSGAFACTAAAGDCETGASNVAEGRECQADEKQYRFDQACKDILNLVRSEIAKTADLLAPAQVNRAKFVDGLCAYAAAASQGNGAATTMWRSPVRAQLALRQNRAILNSGFAIRGW